MDNINKQILKEYRDRSYINSILCEASHSFFNTVNNIIIFPTILGSSVLTCLNSSNIDSERIKYINISINGIITVILAITTQYKLHDRINSFKQHQIKYTKLTHLIEGIINTTINKDTNLEDINNIVSKYDALCEELLFQYPSHIKNKVINRFKNTNIILPNSLMLEASIVIETV